MVLTGFEQRQREAVEIRVVHEAFVESVACVHAPVRRVHTLEFLQSKRFLMRNETKKG